MKRLWLLVVFFGLCTAALWKTRAAPQPSASPFEPLRDQNYTSSREIERLKVAPGGFLWARTNGGVLRFQNGRWQKFSVAPSGVADAEENTIQWRGQIVTANLNGLQIGDGQAARTIALPPSNGTHISAVLSHGAVLWAALFGDGIWQWDGKSWTQPLLHLPSSAREITALAGGKDGQSLWVGTRREGIWRFQKGVWQQYLQPDEPFAHNVQFLQYFRGGLWASTLEDGLIVRDSHGWNHFGKGVLSSNAPRQMAVFKNRLYVRQSNEVVDCFDGQTWRRNVFSHLPRKQIISMAADAGHLYLGQWGGWSAWDGKAFSHHLQIPDLQIVPLVRIFPDTGMSAEGNLWLGTENRGLFAWDEGRQQLRHYDERDGLPDDWITSLTRNGPTVFAGTFNGGIAWRNDREPKWHSDPAWKQVGITAIVPDGAQRTLIATHFGLYCRDEKGVLTSWKDEFTPDQREIQALLPAPNGLWIGTRNGLLFRTRSTLNRIEIRQKK